MLANSSVIKSMIESIAQKNLSDSSSLNRTRWQWLLNPSKFSAEDLVQQLNFSEELGENTGTASFLDWQNSFLWMSLFETTFSQRRFFYPESILKKNLKTSCEPLQILENHLVRYLLSCRDGTKEQADYLLDQLHTEFSKKANVTAPDHQIGELSFSMLTLLESIHQVTTPVSSPVLEAKPLNVVINLGHWEIHTPGKRVISKALCIFIELLNKNISISFDELLGAAFDIPHYDEAIHYQKIQNLISRLRELSAEFVIHTKQGRIYSAISWDQMEICRANSHQGSLAEIFFLAHLTHPNSKKEGVARAAARLSIAKLKIAFEGKFSRQDFEKLTGLPRSTASRFLKKWTAQEILIKSGAGKATSYCFKEAQAKEN